MEPLLGPGFVTAQQVDQARTAQRTSQISVMQAQLQAAEARQGITSIKPAAAELEAARATLALAENDLSKTVAYSPCDGRITALDIAAGEFAATGHPLFTIIDTEHWYAIGDFRETDLAGIEPGRRAIVYVMVQPDRPLRGEVESLGWGVASDVSVTEGGLPHVARTLNWVRIAARFPVRILLDAPPDDLMRVGASAVVVVEK
jgi:membrane fusion protein, multidrug efflux system